MEISKRAIDEVGAMVIEGEGRLEFNYWGRQVLEAAKEQLTIQAQNAAAPIPLGEFFDRRDDMGMGRLRLILDGDADVIVEVIDPEGHSLAVEFCTSFVGGGRSPKVREALLKVIQAIREENLTTPLI